MLLNVNILPNDCTGVSISLQNHRTIILLFRHFILRNISPIKFQLYQHKTFIMLMEMVSIVSIFKYTFLLTVIEQAVISDKDSKPDLLEYNRESKMDLHLNIYVYGLLIIVDPLNLLTAVVHWSATWYCTVQYLLISFSIIIHKDIYFCFLQHCHIKYMLCAKCVL